MKGEGSDVHWHASGRLDDEGLAIVRVPHASREDGAGVTFWTVGDTSGQTVVPEAAVRQGGLVRPR